MLNAVAVFDNSLQESRNQNVLFHHIKNQGIPFNADDLLRGQIVTSMAAFDKLMHDLIRIGMVQIFSGARSVTPKYLAEAIDMQTHVAIKIATLPPPEIVFEQAIVRKLARLSFQDPVKVSDGLSIIWDEKQKWEKIGAILGKSAKNAQTELKLITQRRNAIVHESDMDPVTHAKTPITTQDATSSTNFLEACGKAIHSLI
ncbi:HEPN domain-containing protein [Rhizobium sp. 11_C7_N12_5]|uniref:HEPN domain-containing protein n=1 Tax=Rhizobium sp. 11_C7_N12_5 TaxID=3240770 RepID=UPI003F230F61